ncbi:hypothetical protein KJZ63_03040 [Patescibacteria group bacterium]|nr:hypothetical protein [Patescibacteria group bacterium]
MRKAFRNLFGKLFKVVMYVLMALFVFTRAFNIEDPSLGLVLVLTTASFFIGFIANLKGVILRPLALVVTLLLMVFVISAPFGRYADTDNLFFLAYGLGYLATPLANLKYNIVDKRIGAKKEQSSETEH